MGKKTLVTIAGPTAVGKTAFSIRLAQRLNCEILSADSRQIFREMTIGTAKPSTEELMTVPHHFINSHSIQEQYDAAQYAHDAMATLENLFKKYDTAVLCGGSGLYIKALVEGFDDIPEVPDSVRAGLIERYERHGLPWLQAEMQRLDADHYAAIDQQNPHRLIRALEVMMGTGKSIASFRTNKRRELPFDVIRVGLDLPREVLYDRIDKRMDIMLQNGLIEEAKTLYSYRNHQALQTVGYQEVFDWMDGKTDYQEAVRLLKRNSRRYAKRQLTWFRRDEGTTWFDPSDEEQIMQFILKQLAIG